MGSRGLRSRGVGIGGWGLEELGTGVLGSEGVRVGGVGSEGGWDRGRPGLGSGG